MNTYTYTAEEQYTKLQAFRQACFEGLGTARDALFELGDAVLLTPAVSSFAEFSLSPVFRRRWPSVYEALQDGRPDRMALLRLYVQETPPQGRILLAGDHTAWPRPSAFTLRDRTVEHHFTKVPGNRPITVGQGYATVAWVPEDAGSWALPLLHERISSKETPLQKAAAQLREVCRELPTRPITLWDSEYGCASFVLQTADLPADKIFRLRPTRCLWGPPPPYSGKGRPRIHGEKFKVKDPSTWPSPAATLETDDPKLGRVRILQWNDLHFRQAPDHPMVVIRIERLDARNTRRDPKEFWLAWQGEAPPPSLDASQGENPRAGGVLECSDADAHLAALAGKGHRWGSSTAVAKTPGASHPRTGVSGDGRSFDADWYAGCATQTPRKVSGMAEGTFKGAFPSLSGGQKEQKEAGLTEKQGSLFHFPPLGWVLFPQHMHPYAPFLV